MKKPVGVTEGYRPQVKELPEKKSTGTPTVACLISRKHNGWRKSATANALVPLDVERVIHEVCPVTDLVMAMT